MLPKWIASENLVFTEKSGSYYCLYEKSFGLVEISVSNHHNQPLNFLPLPYSYLY